MTYQVHLRVHEGEADKEEAKKLLENYVQEYEEVGWGNERFEKSAEADIIISGATLIVTSISLLVQIYSELKGREEVHYINLWGTKSERYPVQIPTESKNKVENPESYDIYEIDENITLVICDDMDEVRKVQSDISPYDLVRDLDEN